MSLLSAGDLHLMRDVLDSSLPDTAVVSRASWAADSMGGSIPTFAAFGTWDARVAPNMGDKDETVQGGREVGARGWIVTLPYAANGSVSATDRIVYSGGTLEVVRVKAPRTWQMDVRLDCEQLS